MKLCAFLINSTPINTLLENGTGYEKTDLGSNNMFEAIQDADAVPVGYQDISSIENWEKWGRVSLYNGSHVDYKVVRGEMTALVTSTGWTNLTVTQKQIAAAWFCVAKTQRDEIYTTAQQIQLGMLFHANSIEARQMRVAHAVMDVYNRFSKADADMIMDEVKADNLLELYVSNGREGTGKGDPEGLYDYIEATVGTKYASGGVVPGMAAKSMTPINGHTLQQVVDHAMAILREGDFSPLL